MRYLRLRQDVIASNVMHNQRYTNRMADIECHTTLTEMIPHFICCQSEIELQYADVNWTRMVVKRSHDTNEWATCFGVNAVHGYNLCSRYQCVFTAVKEN